MRGWAVLLTLLVVVACAPATATTETPPRARAPLTATARLGPDAVEVFTEGAGATAALVAAVRGARHSVDAEIYEFGRPELAGAMAAALARGVRVRMVGDPTVDITLQTGRRLAALGAIVGFFPVEPRQIDHVKLMLVDGEVAFFGGVNWGAGSYLNHDFELRIEGPVVARLERLFAVDMQRTGRPAAIPPASDPQPGEPEVVTSFPADQVGQAVLERLRQAHRSVRLEMFVMTDAATIRALAGAARRGVDVRVLFDPGQDLNQAAIAQLAAAGARCRFYRSSGEKLHAKVAVIDGEWLIAGSANWTASGFRHNHELDAVLRSQVLAAAVTARMDVDWAAGV